MTWKDYQVDVPIGEIGTALVERHTVTQLEADLGRMRSAFSFGGGGRYTPEGTYTDLKINNYLVMSDTPDEIRDHLPPIRSARGRCLVNGLGLGIVVNGMLKKPEVEHVTVIEINTDVIALVGPHWQDIYEDRLTIIHANALTHKPPKGERYAVVWHDIWPDICADNLPEMHSLHRKYGRRCDTQGSWSRSLCEHQKRTSSLY